MTNQHHPPAKLKNRNIPGSRNGLPNQHIDQQSIGRNTAAPCFCRIPERVAGNAGARAAGHRRSNSALLRREEPGLSGHGRCACDYTASRRPAARQPEERNRGANGRASTAGAVQGCMSCPCIWLPGRLWRRAPCRSARRAGMTGILLRPRSGITLPYPAHPSDCQVPRVRRG